MPVLHERRIRRQTLTVFATLLGALVAITGWFLAGTWNELARSHARQLSGTAQIVRVATENHLARYAMGLRLLASEVTRDPAQTQPALDAFLRVEPGLVAAFVLGPDGTILAARTRVSGPVPSPRRLPDDALLIAALARDPGRLHVSHPVMTPWSTHPVLYLALRDPDPAGPRIAAALDMRQENALLRSLLAHEADSDTLAFGIMDDAGYLFGRWPLPATLNADRFLLSRRTGSVAHAILDQHAPDGIISTGPIDAARTQGPFTGAFRRLDGYALTAFVVAPYATFRATWWRQVRLPLAGAAGLALALLVLLARELRQQRGWIRAANALLAQTEQAHEAQLRASNQFIQILNQMPGGVLVFNAEGRVDYCSGGFARMTGIVVHPHELIGRSWREVWALVEPIHVGGKDALKQVKTLFHEHRAAIDEVWITDGRIFLRYYTPLFDGDGNAAGALWSLQDITAQKQQESRIRALAERDSLTGLTNRGAFERQLDDALERKTPGLALGIADLDDFKSINDRLGHGAGDALLIEVAARLRGALRLGTQPQHRRGMDVLARIGGDEFAVLLPHVTSSTALQHIAARLMDALRTPFEIEGTMINARLSLGLAMRTGAEDAQTLMRQADIALYAAKGAGRNQAAIFNEAMQAEMDARQGWIGAIEAALQDQCLELYMQPILGLRQDQAGATHIEVGHVEALLRLRDAQGTIHAAGAFEHVLDDPRLAAPVGRWVLQEAAAWAQRWREAGHDLSVSVNISPRHFLGPHCVEDLRSVLDAHPTLPPSALILELTEHGALLDSDATRTRIEACHALGVQVSLDDFGTGSASLIHLQALAVSTLKIERRFVKDILHDARDLSITYGILRTAQLMGVRVVAEGVETPGLARVLVTMGCQYLQGYGIARPMPAVQILDWMRTWPSLLPWTADLGGRTVLGPDGIEAIVSLGTMLRLLLQGGLDDDARQQLLRPDSHLRCSLGRWCFAREDILRDQPGFTTLKQRLAALHSQARRWIVAGPDRQALETDINRMSDALRETFWALTLEAGAADPFVLGQNIPA